MKDCSINDNYKMLKLQIKAVKVARQFNLYGTIILDLAKHSTITTFNTSLK